MSVAIHHFGRSQKYLDRPRYLYALLFDNKCCYVGQTVDLRARERQHRSPQGGWCGQHFDFKPLGVVIGSEATAIDYEHAWRCIAVRHGLNIYGMPPNIVVSPSRQMNRTRSQIASTLRWPGERKQFPWGWVGVALLLAAAIVHFFR